MSKTVEYIWLGGESELRSKTKVITSNVTLENLTNWNYDGSSTKQATGKDSEVVIIPRALFNDPFKENGYLVMCDTYKSDVQTPLDNNYRVYAESIFNKDLQAEPWFGLEQEYFMFDPKTNKPLGFTEDGVPNPQGQYYCSVGAENSFGREIAEEHLEKCIKAGIQVSGMNAEVAPGQWEYQVGPVEGINAGDHLWVARYILLKVAEKHGIVIDIEPKPVTGDWNGSGCHANFSTKDMREKDGLKIIEEAIDKLAQNHDLHMKLYGTGNELRMTGEHETSSFDKFTHGRANRGASVRIGNETVFNKCGYFEDRRPSSNCDPYLVTASLFQTCCLSKDDCIEPANI
jgi:glutamine synthetase|uniref:glutamine synthetase n=1 Tax=viral metagenome TaxID=1070528 RepID=A0A6C0IY07_9ZZZZ